MLRWRRSGEKTAEEGAPTGQAPLGRVEPAPSVDDQALDAFVQVLRAFGQHAFDLEHENVAVFGGRCAAWARHLLNLTPAPGQEDPAAATEGALIEAAPSGGRRDWATVVQFLVARRKREQAHVTKALGDLRQSIWTFAQSLGMALIEDQQMDTRLKSQIDRLQVALERLSPEELRVEVVAAASNLSSLVSERQRMQRERLEALGTKVADLTSQLHEAKEESVRDPLTQLANRRGFDEFLNRMVFLRDVFAEKACLLMIDIDRFKVVNDTYGHPGGDAVLRATADCLARNFPRKSDLVARYGGEEFAVILPTTSIHDATRLAERMLATVRSLQISYGGRVIAVTISVGVGQLGGAESVQDWLDRTDQALYRAKVDGRDRVVQAVTLE